MGHKVKELTLKPVTSRQYDAYCDICEVAWDFRILKMYKGKQGDLPKAFCDGDVHWCEGEDIKHPNHFHIRSEE